MALVVNDRVKETSTSTGTGTIDLDGAVTGFETFVAGIADSNTTYYAIFHQGTTEWEVGLGTVTDATPDTLARTTVITSSNSDSAVSFTAGTKDVFCTLPASKAVYLNASGAAVGALSNVVEDTTPQLGGDLDVNGNAIVSASNGAIAINANGTGTVTMTTNSVTGDVIPGKQEGTSFQGSLLVGHSTTGTLDPSDQASYNTGVGIGALDALTTANGNTAVGYQAGTDISSGSGNTLFGYQAGTDVIGVNNTLIGQLAGSSIVNAHGNICIGEDSGDNITSGDGNTVIGKADVPDATADHQLSISSGQSSGPTWMTGDSSGIVSANGGHLTTTGKALVMGF